MNPGFDGSKHADYAVRAAGTRNWAPRPGLGKIPRRVFVALAAAMATGALSGCGNAPEGAAGGRPLSVAATTTHLADLAREIGGERVSVTGLMGPGVDPHLYRASEGDLGRMIDADLILYHGLALEGKMGEVLERLGERRQVVAAAEAVPAHLLLTDPASPEHPDPHIWFDPALWKLAAGRVAAALAEADPEGAETYQANADAFARRLDDLDARTRERLSAIPERRRVLVTAHDAFGYFGRRYGVEVLGLQGISTESEAGIRDIQRLAEVIVEREVPAVFIETSVSPRTVDAVRAAAAARDGAVELGGSLYSDALGEPGSPAGTYVGMFDANVETIAEALQ